MMKNIFIAILICLISVSLFSQTKVLKPEIVAPENEALERMPDELLNWYAVSGIGQVQYQLQLNNTDSFDDPLIDVTQTATSYKCSELLFGEDYYWRLKSIDEVDESDWTEISKFTVFNKVWHYKPDSGDDELNPEALLRWRNKTDDGDGDIITGITHYTYEVSYDSLFENVYETGQVDYDEFDPGTSIFATGTTELLFDTMYYWRVKAVHDLDETPWSNSGEGEEPWFFYTVINVELDKPEDEDSDIGIMVELKWDDYDGVIGYRFEYCTSEDFSEGCVSDTVSDDKAEISGLDFGTTYYWRVNMFHSQDTSIWSEVWSFETANTVVLDIPTDGSTTTLLPALKWDKIDGVEEFEVQYDVNEDFSSATSINSSSNSYTFAEPLEDDTKYFWRVKALSETSNSEWSETWEFTAQSEQGINDILTKDNINIYPNPSSGRINVKMENVTNSLVEVSVLDLLGQLIYIGSYKFDQGQNIMIIELSDINNGLYIVKMKSGEINYTEKIVIDR